MALGWEHSSKQQRQSRRPFLRFTKELHQSKVQQMAAFGVPTMSQEDLQHSL